jgi:low affinity Fe/Cu permease
VPCGGANHAPPEMVSSNATAAMLLLCVFVIQFARDTNNLQISPAAATVGFLLLAAGKNCCITGEQSKSPPAVRSLLAWQSEFSLSICSFLGGK